GGLSGCTGRPATGWRPGPPDPGQQRAPACLRARRVRDRREEARRGTRRSALLATDDATRFARADRPLRAAPGPREGGVGDRLPGVGRGPPARGGAEGAAPGPCRHVTSAQAVLARGPLNRPGSPRERRPGVQRRGSAVAVPGDGVHSWGDPPATAR